MQPLSAALAVKLVRYGAAFIVGAYVDAEALVGQAGAAAQRYAQGIKSRRPVFIDVFLSYKNALIQSVGLTSLRIGMEGRNEDAGLSFLGMGGAERQQ